MENASKALIIAGAILLAILIISLGIVVYNQASDTISGINMDQQQIETFNNKFTQYQGEKVTAAQVNALRQLVISINGSEKTKGTYYYVSMTYGYYAAAGHTATTKQNWVTVDESGGSYRN